MRTIYLNMQSLLNSQNKRSVDVGCPLLLCLDVLQQLSRQPVLSVGVPSLQTTRYIQTRVISIL